MRPLAVVLLVDPLPMIEMANEQDSLAGVHIDQGPIVANPKLEDVCSLVVRQKAKGVLFFQHPQLLPDPLGVTEVTR